MLIIKLNSSDGNGYRIGLHDDLAGSKLLFVGDKTAGNMTNNENAGTYFQCWCSWCLSSTTISEILGGVA